MEAPAAALFSYMGWPILDQPTQQLYAGLDAAAQYFSYSEPRLAPEKRAFVTSSKSTSSGATEEEVEAWKASMDAWQAAVQQVGVGDGDPRLLVVPQQPLAKWADAGLVSAYLGGRPQTLPEPEAEGFVSLPANDVSTEVQPPEEPPSSADAAIPAPQPKPVLQQELAQPVLGSMAAARSRCLELLSRVSAMLGDLAEAFRHPVSMEEAPDYYEVVARPMDLGTIASKLRCGDYVSPSDFRDDMLLVWDNCLEYNEPGSELYQAAAGAREAFLRMCAEGEQGSEPPRVIVVHKAPPPQPQGVQPKLEREGSGATTPAAGPATPPPEQQPTSAPKRIGRPPGSKNKKGKLVTVAKKRSRSPLPGGAMPLQPGLTPNGKRRGRPPKHPRPEGTPLAATPASALGTKQEDGAVEGGGRLVQGTAQQEASLAKRPRGRPKGSISSKKKLGWEGGVQLGAGAGGAAEGPLAVEVDMADMVAAAAMPAKSLQGVVPSWGDVGALGRGVDMQRTWSDASNLFVVEG